MFLLFVIINDNGQSHETAHEIQEDPNLISSFGNFPYFRYTAFISEGK